MRRILLLLGVISFIVTGCVSKGNFTLIQIKDLFEQHGIALETMTDISKENVFIMSLNDVEPAYYKINKDQLISIYVYSSVNGVKKGIQDFEDKTAAAELVSHDRYQVGNVLIFYESGSSSRDDEVEQVIVDLKLIWDERH
ncbi:hypothetical protein [Paenibacillus sp. sgz500958]|uniref:hypothetical protein n=1 Tax=Paenibacillus sp. sgz500958 TaxID=3242475 RepID=UPI0036D27772